MWSSVVEAYRSFLFLPSQVDLPAISERDARDLAFARKMDKDMVFASFVRRPSDIDDVSKALGAGDKIMVIAKIENQEVVNALG